MDIISTEVVKITSFGVIAISKTNSLTRNLKMKAETVASHNSN